MKRHATRGRSSAARPPGEIRSDPIQISDSDTESAASPAHTSLPSATPPAPSSTNPPSSPAPSPLIVPLTPPPMPSAAPEIVPATTKPSSTTTRVTRSRNRAPTASQLSPPSGRRLTRSAIRASQPPDTSSDHVLALLIARNPQDEKLIIRQWENPSTRAQLISTAAAWSDDNADAKLDPDADIADSETDANADAPFDSKRSASSRKPLPKSNTDVKPRRSRRGHLQKLDVVDDVSKEAVATPDVTDDDNEDTDENDPDVVIDDDNAGNDDEDDDDGDDEVQPVDLDSDASIAEVKTTSARRGPSTRSNARQRRTARVAGKSGAVKKSQPLPKNDGLLERLRNRRTLPKQPVKKTTGKRKAPTAARSQQAKHARTRGKGSSTRGKNLILDVDDDDDEEILESGNGDISSSEPDYTADADDEEDLRERSASEDDDDEDGAPESDEEDGDEGTSSDEEVQEVPARRRSARRAKVTPPKRNAKTGRAKKGLKRLKRKVTRRKRTRPTDIFNVEDPDNELTQTEQQARLDFLVQQSADIAKQLHQTLAETTAAQRPQSPDAPQPEPTPTVAPTVQDVGDSVVEVVPSGAPTQAPARFVGLRKGEEEKFAKPTGESCELQDHQMEGVNWLLKLDAQGLNAILADEMGLGKTVQAVAFLASLVISGARGPHLVIAPKNVCDHWVKEVKTWYPDDLNVVFHAGTAGERLTAMQDILEEDNFDIMVMSHDNAMRDLFTKKRSENLSSENRRTLRNLRKLEFEYLVVDEAHRLKNDQSKMNMGIRHYQCAQRRLLLTGTPLSNNLKELWCLMNVLNPRIFSSKETFNNWFAAPFDNGKGKKVAPLTHEEKSVIVDRLHTVLRPFFRRRERKDICPSYSSADEIVVRCPMSAMQRALMHHFQRRARSPGAGVANVLMAMRNVSNHPFITSTAFTDYSEEDPSKLIPLSGKFSFLHYAVPRLVASGHRILIFSQFRAVLDFIEDLLDMLDLKYGRLDGATDTEERVAGISDFNADGSDIPVFLLTTRAGGVGLNLQTADTVILFDSDWNPSADLQAVSRIQRIGQKRVVHIIRLVTENSVDELIVETAGHKLKTQHVAVRAGQFHTSSGAAKDQRIRQKDLEVLLQKLEVVNYMDDPPPAAAEKSGEETSATPRPQPKETPVQHSRIEEWGRQLLRPGEKSLVSVDLPPIWVDSTPDTGTANIPVFLSKDANLVAAVKALRCSCTASAVLMYHDACSDQAAVGAYEKKDRAKRACRNVIIDLSDVDDESESERKDRDPSVQAPDSDDDFESVSSNPAGSVEEVPITEEYSKALSQNWVVGQGYQAISTGGRPPIPPGPNTLMGPKAGGSVRSLTPNGTLPVEGTHRQAPQPGNSSLTQQSFALAPSQTPNFIAHVPREVPAAQPAMPAIQPRMPSNLLPSPQPAPNLGQPFVVTSPYGPVMMSQGAAPVYGALPQPNMYSTTPMVPAIPGRHVWVPQRQPIANTPVVTSSSNSRVPGHAVGVGGGMQFPLSVASQNKSKFSLKRKRGPASPLMPHPNPTNAAPLTPSFPSKAAVSPHPPVTINPVPLVPASSTSAVPQPSLQAPNVRKAVAPTVTRPSSVPMRQSSQQSAPRKPNPRRTAPTQKVPRKTDPENMSLTKPKSIPKKQAQRKAVPTNQALANAVPMAQSVTKTNSTKRNLAKTVPSKPASLQLIRTVAKIAPPKPVSKRHAPAKPASSQARIQNATEKASPQRAQLNTSVSKAAASRPSGTKACPLSHELPKAGVWNGAVMRTSVTGATNAVHAGVSKETLPKDGNNSRGTIPSTVSQGPGTSDGQTIMSWKSISVKPVSANNMSLSSRKGRMMARLFSGRSKNPAIAPPNFNAFGNSDAGESVSPGKVNGRKTSTEGQAGIGIRGDVTKTVDVVVQKNCGNGIVKASPPLSIVDSSEEDLLDSARRLKPNVNGGDIGNTTVRVKMKAGWQHPGLTKTQAMHQQDASMTSDRVILGRRGRGRVASLTGSGNSRSGSGSGSVRGTRRENVAMIAPPGAVSGESRARTEAGGGG